RLEIENWRWSGVPFFIRTGKCLPVTQTELRLGFPKPPPAGVAAPSARAGACTLLRAGAQRAEPVEPEQMPMDVVFPGTADEEPAPYEVLLAAAMRGDSTRFVRQDSVEQKWRGMAPLLCAR